MSRLPVYKNKARCKNCKDVIESKGYHHRVSCSCYSAVKNTGIYLDGGATRQECGGNDSHLEPIFELLE